MHGINSTLQLVIKMYMYVVIEFSPFIFFENCEFQFLIKKSIVKIPLLDSWIAYSMDYLNCQNLGIVT